MKLMFQTSVFEYRVQFLWPNVLSTTYAVLSRTILAAFGS